MIFVPFLLSRDRRTQFRYSSRCDKARGHVPRLPPVLSEPLGPRRVEGP
eukprot:COSAG01_NODE_64171_length_277_cov_1.101124_1_plen_48_part_10